MRLPVARLGTAAAALVLALAGCTTTGGQPGDVRTKPPRTTASATAEPADATSTSATDCLIGEWEYDTAAGVLAAYEAMGTPEGAASVDASGSSILALDGKHAMLRYDEVQINLRVVMDGSELVELIRFDGEGSAIYQVSGDEITIGRFDMSGTDAEITATVDGEPLDLGVSTDDFMASLSSFTNAQTFTCDATTLTMTDEAYGMTTTQTYARR